MRKAIYIFFALFGIILPLHSAGLCNDFDDSGNIITIDCDTKQRVLTKNEIKKREQELEAARQQKAAQEMRALEAKQKQLEKALEKRKNQLEKEKKKGEKKTAPAQTVQINGNTYSIVNNQESRYPVGICSHDWMLSVYGGFGTYRKGESNYNAIKIPVKNMAFWSGGLSGLFFLNSYLGLGLGIEADQFQHAKSGARKYSYTFYMDVKSQISLQKVMLLGRLNLNPAHASRLYVPFGIGEGRVHEKQQGTIDSFIYGYHYNIDETKTKYTVVYFAGIGLEFDLTDYVSLGLEGRYNQFVYNKSTFNYINGLAKINVKF